MQQLIAAVREAGRMIVQMRQQGIEVSQKANKDVLTQADLLANQILKSRLHDTNPSYGWLSEESVDDSKRAQFKRVWIVDPIDGTREFIEGVPEYAVSVALVENGIGLMAAIYNPETDELFTAERGQGAYLNGQRIYCKPTCVSPLHLLASRSETKRGEWDRFKQEKIQSIGSIAYKLGLIAAGYADATFSLGPKSEWDIAAGVLLVTEAGGSVTDAAYQAFQFNQQNVLVNGIIATSQAAEQNLKEMLSK